MSRITIALWAQSLIIALLAGLMVSRGCSPGEPVAVKPGPIAEPKPQPVETPAPALSPLEQTAKDYLHSFSTALASVAAEVRTGSLATKDSVIAAMSEAHNPKRVAWTSALDKEFSRVTDNAGKITDLDGAARILETASAAMK